MKIQDLLENSNKRWYHGSSHNIRKFTTEFVGTGNDQFGPGIYFTDNAEDATSYARKLGDSGYLYEVQLNYNKLLSSKNNSKVRQEELKKLIWESENFEQKLIDFDMDAESPKNGLKQFLGSAKNEASALDMMTSVAVNFYQNDMINYVSNLSALGYDACIVPRGFANFCIVYNPKIIEIVNSY